MSNHSAKQSGLHVGDVIDAICGSHIPGSEMGCDTIKWGSRCQHVSGIACTFMSTVEVVKKARSLGCDLIITHEPTFYNHDDEPNWEDEVAKSKWEFLSQQGEFTIWRWHDRCHWCSGLFSSYGRDTISDSFTEVLRWEAYRRGTEDYAEQNRFDIPASTLGAIAAQIQKNLAIPTHAIRIAGDPDELFTKVSILLGLSDDMVMQEYQTGDVEVVITGETYEWQYPEYVRDSCALGQKKGLILLGHCNSEEHGMEQLTKWLQKKFGEQLPVGIHFVPSQDPFFPFVREIHDDQGSEWSCID